MCERDTSRYPGAIYDYRHYPVGGEVSEIDVAEVKQTYLQEKDRDDEDDSPKDEALKIESLFSD